MANGETTAVRVTEADLAAVPSPPPEFGRWLRTAYEYGWLNDMVQALIQGGRCTDVQTALIYLQQVSESTRLEIRYAVADFGGKPSAHRINVLRRLLTGDQARRRDPHVWHGMLGHQLVNALFSGKLQSHLVAPPPTTTQLGLFGSDSAVEVAGVMVSTTKHTAALYRRITHLTRLIAPQVKEHGWHGWRRRRRHFIALQQCLLELAPRLVTSVRDVDGFEHEDELFPLTLLSWGAAVAARLKHRRDRVLFTEMPVLHTRHGMSGGRIDAMEVRSINGKQPTRRQLATLRHLVKARERGDDRLRSVGDVLYTITTQFGSRLDVVIYDWKFLVGDLWKRWAEQTLPNLEAPLETHRRQMHRYLTLVPMDLALGRKPTETWHDLGELTLSCELWYFLPHSPALVHTLTLTPDERQRLFRTLARRQGAIHNAAVFRTRTNSVVGHLVRDVLSTSGRGNVNNGGRNGYKKKNGDTVQERLFDQATLAMPTARRLLEAESVASREYVDSLGIIERVQDDRTDGRTRLVLHYDHLLAHLDELHASQFDRERGGALCCLLHDERTPSMRVYLADARPHFHCYACAAHGEVDHDSVPGDVRGVVERSWRQGAVAMATVNENLHGILTVAQEALSRVFPQSRSAVYLREERCIDPDLAASLGAGHADDRLIEALLDAGYTVEQLFHYGFLTVVPGEYQNGIVPLLRRRGIPLEGYMVRMKSGGTASGIPAATFRDRVTFPLGVCGSFNNLYGRAIWPNCQKHSAHRKLTIKGTRVRQGGWNLGVLQSGSQTVYITEGVMDVLSLLQSDYPALAMVGVGNIAIVREIVQAQACHGMKLAIALDWDKGGRDGTERLVQALQEEHAPGKIQNFTEEFIRRLPTDPCAAHAATPCKDYNGLVVRHNMLAR